MASWSDLLQSGRRGSWKTCGAPRKRWMELDEHCSATRRRRKDSRSSTWLRSRRGKRPYAHRGTGQPSRGKRRKKTRRWSWRSDGFATITTRKPPIEPSTAKYATWRALSLHGKRARGLGLLITKLFRYNVCPSCECTPNWTVCTQTQHTP